MFCRDFFDDFEEAIVPFSSLLPYQMLFLAPNYLHFTKCNVYIEK